MDPFDRYLKIDRCCGCTSLRTGGIIMGCFGIFSALLGIPLYAIRPEIAQQHYIKTYISSELNLFFSVLNLILSGCFLYGIFNNQSAFLLPEVILAIMGLCMLIIVGVFFVPIALLTIMQTGNIRLVKLIIVFVTLGLLCWHLTAVSYSLYNQIKENESRPNNTTATNETYAVYLGATAPQYPGVYTLPQYPDANTLPPYSAVYTVPQYISTTSNTVPLYPNTNTVPQDQTSKA